MATLAELEAEIAGLKARERERLFKGAEAKLAGQLRGLVKDDFTGDLAAVLLHRGQVSVDESGELEVKGGSLEKLVKAHPAYATTLAPDAQPQRPRTAAEKVLDAAGLGGGPSGAQSRAPKPGSAEEKILRLTGKRLDELI